MPLTSFFGAVLYVHSKAGPGYPIVVPAWTAKVFCIRKKQNQAPNSGGSEEVAAAAESQTFHGEPESQAEIDELPTENGKNAGNGNTKATKRKGPQDVKEKNGEDKLMERPSMQVAEESTGTSVLELEHPQVGAELHTTGTAHVVFSNSSSKI